MSRRGPVYFRGLSEIVDELRYTAESISTQLLMYCYSGQRFKDESSQVAPEIYSIFEWSHLTKSSQKLLLFAMMRSQRECHLSGAFFMVDLSLFVWVLRTGGSLIAMLKTLDEKQCKKAKFYFMDNLVVVVVVVDFLSSMAFNMQWKNF
uniref:Uncharacterized protein n=1 Tax=Glossina brevipalpis TaxID=37001 RepID=A0A1A9WP02_9MUSC